MVEPNQNSVVDKMRVNIALPAIFMHPYNLLITEKY